MESVKSSALPGAILQLKVRLLGISPMIWRRVLVPASMSLRELHGVVQLAMGWEGIHLFEFAVRGVRYAGPDRPYTKFDNSSSNGASRPRATSSPISSPNWGPVLHPVPAASDPRSTATRKTPDRPGAASGAPRSGSRRSSTSAESTSPPSSPSRCTGSTPRSESRGSENPSGFGVFGERKLRSCRDRNQPRPALGAQSAAVPDKPAIVADIAPANVKSNNWGRSPSWRTWSEMGDELNSHGIVRPAAWVGLLPPPPLGHRRMPGADPDRERAGTGDRLGAAAG